MEALAGQVEGARERREVVDTMIWKLLVILKLRRNQLVQTSVLDNSL